MAGTMGIMTRATFLANRPARSPVHIIGFFPSRHLSVSATAHRCGRPPSAAAYPLRTELATGLQSVVIGLTKPTACEVTRRGVRVNAACPAAISRSTDHLCMGYSAMTKDQMAEAVPLERVYLPEDVAAAVLFLRSDQAAFITGTYLAADGRYSAQ
jgi:NAD(P)-dependent dehydrogenase (short-subunit alcohol dehydrogenase family)